MTAFRRFRHFHFSLAAAVATTLLSALPGGALFAGPAPTLSTSKNVIEKVEERTTLDAFEAEASYVGSSNFKDQQFGGSSGLPARSYGSQDESHFVTEYSHRFLLTGNWYLRAGLNYERFDFGTSFAPVPTTLQSVAGVIALEYVVKNTPGFFIRSKPGIYFSNGRSIDAGNFDAPTDLGVVIEGTRIFSSLKSVYFLVGAHGSILGKNPVVPFGGVVWLISDRLRLEAIPPEPQLIFRLNDKIDLFVGAELLGQAYKRDRNPNYRPQDQRFNNGVIDYTEWRVGAGVSINITKGIELDFTGGYVPERDFAYYRGNSKSFKLEGAPYAKVAFKAEF
jgi:hypothetical protein